MFHEKAEVCKPMEKMIVPENNYMGDELCDLSVCVIIYLYYVEHINWYMTYVKNIPEFVDIYIISSRNEVLELAKAELGTDRSNIIYLKKPNRGRDVSALLVCGKEIVKKYEFIGFVHDKKAKDKMSEDYLEKWEMSIWENLLGSRDLIFNILWKMKTIPELGALFPPMVIQEEFALDVPETYWACGNENNTKELCEMLMGKRIDVTQNEAMYTIRGTVFWARKDSLQQLFDYPWKYDDFPEEPMDDDGTISHAIERCLPFVVEMNGYKVKHIMSTRYAEYDAGLKEQYLIHMMRLLGEIGCYNILFADEYTKKQEQYKKMCSNKKVYIFGNGYYGEMCYRFLRMIDISPLGFLVTKKENGNREYLGIPLYSILEVVEKLSSDALIMIAVSKLRQVEIEELLTKYKCDARVVFE